MADVDAFMFAPIPPPYKSPVKDGYTYCETCHIYVTNGSSLVKHTNSKRHQTKLKLDIDCENCGDVCYPCHYIGPGQVVHCTDCYRNMLLNIRPECSNCEESNESCHMSDTFNVVLCGGCEMAQREEKIMSEHGHNSDTLVEYIMKLEDELKKQNYDMW
jgi:hypothetical protein